MTEIVVKNRNLIPCLQDVCSGVAFEDFLQSQKATSTKHGLSDLGAYNLRTSTIDILSHCNPHDAVDNPETTHLAVGYVQSGKTMSFTGVLAMARDNGYRISIVLTGITTNLLGQTSDRLSKDLNNNPSEDRFAFVENPSPDDVIDIIKALRLSDKPLLIIPILKHKKYLNDLTALFKDARLKKEIRSETVLIIDDEADQASLNSYGYANSNNEEEEEKKMSATYAAILKLRSVLPGNSYIQYTATPQANLLITMTDLLSPKSHTLLQPGEDYIGGRKFFGMAEDNELYGGHLAIKIPENEVYHKKTNPLHEMPKSLREALMLHVWGCVLVIKWYKRGVRQLSMMVHPTDIIEGNKVFEKWINDELNEWSDALAKPTWSQEYVQLMERFRESLPDAIQFYPEQGRPKFEDVSRYIPDIINDSHVYRITGNSDDDPKSINWDAHRMNVLVGAQMLNRGFTVEKLATTYMPRYSTSVSNADTIEQRCRFFGYKKDYIESCRAFLPAESIQDYKDYVLHEEELRSLLATCSTLKHFEHSLMLSSRLRPTRKNVLPKQVVKSRLSKWNSYDRMTGGKMLVENKNVVEFFVNRHLSSAHDFVMADYDSHKYKTDDKRKHSLKDMQVSDIMELLTDYNAGNYADTITKAATIRYLNYLADKTDIHVKVIFMSNNLIRERSMYVIDDDMWSVELFQGRSKLGAPDFYVGDRNIYDTDAITLQIHHLNILGLPIAESSLNETYAIAIYIPEKLATQYITTVNT